jgi:drug/metabolite transporter (DMT)-like permease
VTLAALFLVASQLLLRLGVRGDAPLTVTNLSQFGGVIWRVLTSPILLLGYALSGVSAFIFLLVLSRFELSYAAPIFMAIYYVLLLLASAVILREGVTPSRWLGAVIVIIGIWLISQNR